MGGQFTQSDELETAVKILFLFFYIFLFLDSVKTGMNKYNAIGLITFFIMVAIFFYRPKFSSRWQFMAAFLCIIILGTAIRLYLAFFFDGNFDMKSYDIVSNLFIQGQNIYHETTRYNYSPLWLTVLGLLKQIPVNISFSFIVRCFLTCIDLLTLIVLIGIARLEKISDDGLIVVALLFYLNPVSFLITGYHGQFDNLALVCILIGLYMFLKNNGSAWAVAATSWMAFSTGVFVKHIVVGQYLTGVNNLFKKPLHVILAVLVTLTFFLASFLPYWSTGSQGIIRNVFLYSSIPGIYGISSLINLPSLKFVFIIGVLVYPFLIHKREIITQFLLTSLFFLAFTTGMGEQYFVLPIVWGALRSSGGFLCYTAVTGIVLLGSANNMKLSGFDAIGMNAVWIIVLAWFVFLHFNLKIKNSFYANEQKQS
jgi:hypothetical protein